MAKNNRKWDVGTVFAVPLASSECGFGQVVSTKVLRTPSVALFALRMACATPLEQLPPLHFDTCFSILTVSAHALDKGIWRLLGQRDLLFDQSVDPNARLRINQYVGSRFFTDNMVDAFFNAYFGLEPWDDFADPETLDKLLIPPHVRPNSAIFKRKPQCD